MVLTARPALSWAEDEEQIAKPVPRQNSSERERLTFLPVAGTLEPS